MNLILKFDKEKSREIEIPKESFCIFFRSFQDFFLECDGSNRANVDPSHPF